MAEIFFIPAAIGELRCIGPEVVPKVLNEVLLLEGEPTADYPLGGELAGYRKLIVDRNTWCIVYRITDDKSVENCEVWAVGERADAEVYAEATARIKEAGAGRPEFVQLAAVIERLGRLAGPTGWPIGRSITLVPGRGKLSRPLTWNKRSTSGPNSRRSRSHNSALGAYARPRTARRCSATGASVCRSDSSPSPGSRSMKCSRTAAT